MNFKSEKELILFENAQDCLYYGMSIASNPTNQTIIKELGKKRANEIIKSAFDSVCEMGL